MSVSVLVAKNTGPIGATDAHDWADAFSHLTIGCMCGGPDVHCCTVTLAVLLVFKAWDQIREASLSGEESP